MKKTKIFIIVFIIFALWLGWVLVYFKKAKKEITEEKKEETLSKEFFTPFFKTGETEKISKVILEKVLYPKQFSDNEIYYYLASENRFFIFDLKAKAKNPLEINFLGNEEDLIEVKWHPSIKKVVITKVKKDLTSEEEEISHSLSRALSEKIIYDLETKKSLEIKSPYYIDIELLEDNKFAYYYLDPQKEENKIFQEDLFLGGLSKEELVDLGRQKTPYSIEFYGQDKEKLYYSKIEDGDKSVFRYNMQNKKNEKIISGASIVSFSSDFSRVFYSLYGNKYFAIYDLFNDVSREIKFDGLTDYILWNKTGDYFYYFKGEIEEAGRYEFYFLLSEIFKYDLEKNQSGKVADFSKEGNIGVKDVFLSFDEKSIYFTNIADLNLYRFLITK